MLLIAFFFLDTYIYKEKRVNKRNMRTSAQNSAYISLAVSLVTGHNFVTEHKSQAVIIRPITLSLKKITLNCMFGKELMITLRCFYLPFLSSIRSINTIKFLPPCLLLPHFLPFIGKASHKLYIIFSVIFCAFFTTRVQ